MTTRRLLSGIAPLAMLLVLLAPAAAPAQVTTGNIVGQVISATDRSPVPGATVTIVHVPTGSSHVTVTGEGGEFTQINAKPGGPYTVRVELDGFQTVEQNEVRVALGATTRLEVPISMTAVSEEITVTGSAEDLINPSRQGSQSELDFEEIQAFPTVRRNALLDGAKTNPYASIRASDENQKDISFAGRSSKYNNIQIDGSNYNDLFGLGESGGTPGGQSNAQPIQQDVIQELQVSVSPYDVRQSGFTGGAINAVTRSGSNDFHGSAYYAQRDPDYVGEGPFEVDVKNFDEEQYGASVGGRVIKDRLFFFAAYEQNERGEESGFSADGSTGQQFGKPADAAAFREILIEQYGYDPGGLGDIPIDTESEHLFARFDWTAAANHNVLFRYSLVDAFRDDVATRSTTQFRFPGAVFARDAKVESMVAQLNSVLGSNMFNEARVGLQTMEDERIPASIFPAVEVGGASRRADLIGGTEQFSGVNLIEQDVLEVHDDLTWLSGDHTWTFGTHNEFFDIKNFFLPSATGYYFFPNLSFLEQGLASVYQIGFVNGPDPSAPASDFGVSQYGLYGGDHWRVNDTLSFTYGLRADYTSLDDDPAYNPVPDAALGVDTSNVPGSNLILSPRVGFNWDPTGEGEQQLRGGVGLFAGRTPYVWISNVYAGTGIATTTLDSSTPSGQTPNIPFNPDPFSQPHTGFGAAPVISAIDPDFEFPQVIRSTLGYDHTLPWWGLRGTAELLYSLTEQDIYYVNLNRAQTGTSALDGRPTYARVSTAVANVPQLTNTGEGEDLMVSLMLSRPSSIDGFGFTAGYTYSDSQNAFDGTSSQANSNWTFHPTRGDIFREELSTSSWENENRYWINATYDFQTGSLGHTIGLFYNAESGRPFSILMDGDPNRDSTFTNDLLYVPGGPGEVILRDFTWEQFETYLSTNGVDCRGCILKRNDSVGPWVRRLDFHYGLELPISMLRVEVTADLINVLNLIDNEDGVVRYVNFGTTTPIEVTFNTAANKYEYFQNIPNGITNPGSPYIVSDLQSRWQARLGLKLSF